MCLNMMNRSQPQPSTTTSVATPAKKKKPTLLNQGGGNRQRDTGKVDTGMQGRSGFDSFGNREGQRGGMTGRY